MFGTTYNKGYKMNKKFKKRLTDFLDSEVKDYEIKYKIESEEEYGCAIELEKYNNICYLSFQYIPEKDELELEMNDSNFEVVREFDWTVKYFWMLVAPSIFGEREG